VGHQTLADLDECDANAGSWFVSPSSLRVGLDLDGSLESLGNSMTDLADAIDRTGECDLVRFRIADVGATRTKNETHWPYVRCGRRSGVAVSDARSTDSCLRST
jgi:hypothetical protein